MFLLDSLMINGISWALKTVVTAAEAEMNDDTALREQLLAAEMQREMGEITDEDFAGLERDLLERIREIKERREGGSGPLEFGAGQPIEADEGSRFQIEASISGDFYEPANAPHTTVVEEEQSHPGIIGTASGQTERVIDIEPTHPDTFEEAALPLPAATPGAKRTTRKRSAAPKPRRSSTRKATRAKAGRIR
jgi:hypothetical protein